jgi:hypothetical protein
MDKLPDSPVTDRLLVVVARAADTPGFTADQIKKIADPAQTLWLIRKPETSAAAPARERVIDGPIRPVTMPIAIETLAAFIRSGAAAMKKPAAVAA